MIKNKEIIEDNRNEYLYCFQDNRLVVFADETTPRYVRATCILDYDTVAIGDRFGNIAVVSHTLFLKTKKPND